MPETTTRGEHVRWCKQRARECLDHGNAQDAVTSMMSDLNKHPETVGLVETMASIALC